jgi:hypothetical protein
MLILAELQRSWLRQRLLCVQRQLHAAGAGGQGGVGACAVGRKGAFGV